MVNSTIISKVFIGENEIKSILDKLKLNYEYGHNNESFWVYDNKETALIIEINKVDEFGYSKCDKENIEELLYSKHKLPIESPHCFSIEHSNTKIFNLFLNEISIFAPDSYVIHEIKDKYIKL